MSENPFFQFYPSDWLAGTRGLTAAETGIYITLVALMYEAEGPIANDAKRLARLCGSTPAAFNRAIEGLIETGKISLGDLGFFNSRVEFEIKKRSEKRSAATSNAKSRWEKVEKNQKVANADASISQCGTDASQKPEARSQKEANASSVRAPEAPPKTDDRAADFRRRIVKLYDPAIPPDTGYVSVWLGQGYDPEICMGVITAIVQRGRKPASLKYFDGPIHEAHQRKAPVIAAAKPVTPVDPAKVTPTRWHRLLDDWHSNPKDWPRAVYGPAPGEPGCMCPQEIINLENERRGKVAA